VAISDSSVIAIVDDDESVRQALKSLMRSVGFNVETFASAEDFLKADCLQATACLLLDLRLPGISGLELQRQLGAARRRVPVIFITAHGNEADQREALEGGAIDFLRKPFSEEALLKAVHSALRICADV
jgi:FixJ family two-component response regulator